jgi:hypothetical protein
LGKDKFKLNSERKIIVRFSEKGEHVATGNQQMFGVNFHDFMEKENATTSMELASEFGLSLRDVKQLKKRLGRS